MKLRSHQIELLERLTQTLASKQAQSKRLREKCEGLESQLERLNSKGEIEKALDVQIKLNGANLMLNALDNEIEALGKDIEIAQQGTDREVEEARLVQLGMLAAKQRKLYEERWHELDGLISQMAPEMVKAYIAWRQAAMEFSNKILQLDIASNENYEGSETAKQRAAALFADLDERGVDWPSIFTWTDLKLDRKLRPNKDIEAALSPLDGPYVKAIDLIHETCQYGSELWENLRILMGVKHTHGRFIHETRGSPMTRPFFPVKDIGAHYVVNWNGKGAKK